MNSKIRLPAKADDYIPDPFDMDGVLTRVLDALRRQEDARRDRDRISDMLCRHPRRLQTPAAASRFRPPFVR
jgi:DNA-binding response OmpR family regulator